MAYLEGYSEPCQISKEVFTQIVNGLNLLIICVKSSISDVWLGSEYASDIYWYTVQVQEIFLVSWCFALITSVELLSIISREVYSIINFFRISRITWLCKIFVYTNYQKRQRQQLLLELKCVRFPRYKLFSRYSITWSSNNE